MKKQTKTTTTSWNYPTLFNPIANIACCGNRIKSYNHEGEERVYLEDGTEFELEFYNDSGDYVKADITINGKQQSSSLVLRPYQRFYLDRFMDEKKKFKFNTFLTGNDDIEKLKEIIEKNGRIKVEFYQEIKPLPITWTTTVQETFDSHLYDNTLDGGGTGNPIFPDTLTFDGNQSRGMSSGGNKSLSKSVNCCNYSANIGMKNEPEEIESGRIESGKKSKQDFVTTDRQFSMFAAATFEYHIMPISHKPKKAKRRDVIIADDIRTYCPGCGRRLKKGWNFCAGCGHRF